MSLTGTWRAVVDAFSGSCRWSPRCCWRCELDSASFGLRSPVEMRWRWPVRVQRVVMPVTGAESWTVVDDGWVLVEPVERCLAHLAGIERSPNTVRAYAHGLRLWFESLGARGLVWDSVGIEDVSRFVAWLRAPADNVIVFDDTAAVRGAATVNRHLGALFGFCDLRARSGLRRPSTRSPGSKPTTTNSENTSPSTSVTGATTASPTPSATCLRHDTPALDHHGAKPSR